MKLQSLKLSSLDLRYGGLRLSDPAGLRRLKESIRMEGLRAPVLVSSGIEEGKLVLVDGFKRLQALKESGASEILARVEALDAPAAHAALYACNRASRGMSDLEEAWVVRSLHRGLKLPQVKISALLGRHKSWVCRRLRLVEGLDEELQEEIRLGLLSSSMARELTRLPRCNQVPVMQSIREHGLSSRQTSKLVTKLLESTEPGLMRALLADPLKYVANEKSAGTAAVQDPLLSKVGNELRDCLLALQGKSWRLMMVGRGHGGFSRDEAKVLVPMLKKSIEKVSSGLELMHSLLQDSSRWSNGDTQASGV